MHNFISFIKEFRLPKKNELINALRTLTKKQFWIFIGVLIVSLISMLVLVQKINNYFMVEKPADGGSITEGIIGIPSLVNPVLALSAADKDLTAIIYSGLMRKMPDGRFVPDLAESYTVSRDGTIYTFVLKKNVKFHDGTSVTPDDILFTIDKINDPLIKSPRRASWDGIIVEKKDDKTITFTLKKPYISFMDNTTLGILPMHLWKNISVAEFGVSPLNVKAIGSGPYQVESVSRNADGLPETYTLKRFKEFTLGKPHIKSLTFVSYANENALMKALLSHSIDQTSGLSPDRAYEAEEAGYTLHTATLPRMFGIFFNAGNNKMFAQKDVIRAMNIALDRQGIIDTVLHGYGTPIKNPIPQTLLSTIGLDEATARGSIEEANAILDKAGWTKGADGIREKGGTQVVTKTKKVGGKTITQKMIVKTSDPVVRLAFSLTTGDTPELKDASVLVKDQLAQIGIEVNLQKVYETGQLKEIIRAREYEALFFGQIVNHESDLFSFWHSSQKNDPGLNIALYGNKTIDTLLEQALGTLDPSQRTLKYASMSREFSNDIPALLVYSPTYLYATSRDLKNINLDTLTVPADRFVSLHTWYANIDRVWKIFTN